MCPSPADPDRIPPSGAARDHYGVLGVTPAASAAEIKGAYRSLVKRHHPDAGGDDTTILALNAAWEVLGDRERRRLYDRERGAPRSPAGGAPSRAPGSRRNGGLDAQVLAWMRQVYVPIDRLLGEVIDPFPAQLRALAGDPYDDRLMEVFCGFLERSRGRLEDVESLFRSRACPTPIQGFGLSVYHCLSQVKDALAELERYTMGYVDGYLHDGREMLREAGRRRSSLQEEWRRLEV